MSHLEASKIAGALLLAVVLYSPAIAQSSHELEAIRRQIGQLGDAGRYDDAVAVAKKALRMAQPIDGWEYATLGRMLNLVGGLYAAQGRAAEAERTFQRSLAIAQQELGPDHPDVADLLNNLGALHDIQGHYPQAETLYRQALAIRLKVLSPDHPDLAISYVNLARLHRQRTSPLAPAEAPHP